jgi:hypothetical protein
MSSHRCNSVRSFVDRTLVLQENLERGDCEVNS